MAKNPYDVLGVDKKSSKDEIKKAYRKKAKENHPDKGGDEKKFKDINEAYQTLSDDNKKSQYDQFGSTGGFGGGGYGGGQSGGFEDIFKNGGFTSSGGGGFEDIFSSFFGGGGGGSRGGQQGSRSQRGSDMEVEVTISFEESIEGCQKDFAARSFVSCKKCSGKGGEGEKKCTKCNGTGHIKQQFQTPFGVVAQNVACPLCQGSGAIFENTCSDCHGEGRKEEKHRIFVDLPAGVDNGETIKVSGKGEAGRKGGSAGALFVHINVKSSPYFKRIGLDLISELNISVFDALLGGDFKVDTFWGEVTISVPENTKDGTKLRIKGKGVKKTYRSGDHIVIINYEMPKKISKKLREKLEEIKKI